MTGAGVVSTISKGLKNLYALYYGLFIPQARSQSEAKGDTNLPPV